MPRYVYLGNVDPYDGTQAISLGIGHYVAQGEEFEATEEQVDAVRHLFFLEKIGDVQETPRETPFVSEVEDDEE